MTFFNYLLILHIFSGCVALISAVIALSTKKGAVMHRKMGRYFFYSMSGIFVTAIPMSLIINSHFLFCIAIFSYYLAWSGWRYALRKQLPATHLDKLISFIMLAVSLLMTVSALLSWGTSSYQSIVLLIFGLLGARFSFSDLVLFRKKQYPQYERLIRHVGSMIGGTIAVFTAVLVVNIHLQPEWIVWLAPTVVFLPLIAYWVNRVKAGNI